MTESDDNAPLLAALEEIRKEMRHQRALLVESIDLGRSIERQVDAHLMEISQRIRELKDDLELLIKSELMGLLGNLDGDAPRR
jgi:hypothetical protein